MKIQQSSLMMKNMVPIKNILVSCMNSIRSVRNYRRVRNLGRVSQTKSSSDVQLNERHTENHPVLPSRSENIENSAKSNLNKMVFQENNDSLGQLDHLQSEETINSSLKDLQTSIPHPSDLNSEFPSDIDRLNKQKLSRDQSRHAFRPKVNPNETSLFLFPGQGSQFVGMGRQLTGYPNVEEMYAVASKILGYNLLDMCINGPKEELNKTVYCQPAIMVTSLAAVEKLKHTDPWAIENCVSAAGFSVGEYSALVFAGALSFEDGVRLVKVRAEAMQKASEEVSGRMMTVFLKPEAKIRFACHAAKLYCSKELQIPDPVCDVSNYLYPECKVVAGHAEAVDFIAKNAKEFGIRRVQYLPVSGAFHTPLMYSAQKLVSSVLSGTELKSPVIPVHSNVTSLKYGLPKTMPRLLLEHLYRPVKWEQTMHVLYSRRDGEAFPYTFEVGPGKQLGSILKMVNSKAYTQYKNVNC